MILAEKIVRLRKQRGWSQEKLAAQLQVSRQSVSKWESMISMPDLDKIVRMSQIFGVSTDYLLNEKAQLEDPVPRELSGEMEKIRPVSLEEANGYLEQVSCSARKIALGVALCILCPAPVILLGVLSEQPGGAVTEGMAAGIGVGILLVMIAAAVALFLLEGLKLDRYAYLEKESIQTEYGVAGIAERKREDYEPRRRQALVLGVTFCILSAVPLILTASFQEENDVFLAGAITLLLMLVALGVFLMVESGMVWSSFQKLLEEGNYTREKKQENRANGPIAAIYLSVTTALYLAWSFVTFRWEHTWIIWPVAAVLYGAIQAISNYIRGRKRH